MRRESGLYASLRTPTPVVARSRIGRYEILERLALGGMAEVYLAVHGELSGFRTLAVVKKVLPHLAENPNFIAMFLDEARIAALLDHPNIVRIFEVGKSGTEYFLAMELVQGKSLAGFQRRAAELDEPVDPKVAALIIAHAAAGLHHAHRISDADGKSLGLVHRDVSPQNILISFEGSVKVIDFGIARALGRLSDTSTGGMKGKIGYMAPEQARGEEIDHRTDIFALGVVLWETICGQRLFSRDSEFGTMRAILETPIPRPSSIIFKVPASLDNIVMRALARDPRERFQSAADMAAALEKYIVQAGGATATDLSALMKFFFGEEQVRWKTTVRTVLDLPSTQDSIEPIELTPPPPGLPPADPPETGRRPPPAHTQTGALSAQALTAPSGAAQGVPPSSPLLPPFPAPPRFPFSVSAQARGKHPATIVALILGALAMGFIGALAFKPTPAPEPPPFVPAPFKPATQTSISIEPLPTAARAEPNPTRKPARKPPREAAAEATTAPPSTDPIAGAAGEPAAETTRGSNAAVGLVDPKELATAKADRSRKATSRRSPPASGRSEPRPTPVPLAPIDRRPNPF